MWPVQAESDLMALLKPSKSAWTASCLVKQAEYDLMALLKPSKGAWTASYVVSASRV